MLPLLALNLLGRSKSAYFSQAWIVAMPLYLVVSSVASSFTVEAAANPSELASHSLRALLHAARLVVPLALLLLLGAPLVLGFFGPAYSREGSVLLHWLALAALPAIVSTWYLSYARLRNGIG
jgi:O-antigen/teichoic acid export membrane protein